MITFNMQTYGLLPVGTKRVAPPASTFNPDQLDTDAWVQAARSFGAKYAVLTASHRSGFALWPTKSHNYSIAFSGQAGRDILREYVASCRKFGLAPGVFWTQRFNDYFGVSNNGIVNPARAVQPVSQAQYDSMMSMQLSELAAYGFTEFWVNGQIDGDSAAVLTKQLARLFPNATCHSCSGVPTKSQIRWVGTGEMGVAAQPSWSSADNVNGSGPNDGDEHHGDPHGSMYAPPSCDAVLREHCWFGGKA
jgi:alpha-L-fucosidase